MDLGLSGHSAVVAGGSRGMGRATAELLAGEGCRVAMLARTDADQAEIEESLREAGAPDVVVLQVDLLDTGEVEAAFTFIDERWGELNILVNASGSTMVGGIDELSDNDWLEYFDVGVVTMVRSVRAALPLMRKAAFGRIVNIAATSIRHQSPGLIGYTASMAALASASKNLARSLAPQNILVNTVCPGMVMTPALEAYLRLSGSNTDLPDGPLEAAYAVVERDFGTTNDIGRVGLPEEIGAMVLFLCSVHSAFTAGATIAVDGGTDFF